MDLTLSSFETGLADRRIPDRPRRAGLPRAAVAAFLRFDGGDAEVLLMKRSEHEGDRWSGQVSMPGGREEAGDARLRDTAVRETLEEVGVDLEASGRFLGRLDPTRAVARGRVVPLTITPFVWAKTAPVEITLNHEASHWFWFPLARAACGELDATHEWRMGPLKKALPCWRFEDFTVWGLTYKMLNDLLAAVG